MGKNNKSLLSKIWVRIPLLGLLLLGVAQCGTSGLSSDVTISMIPNLPIVITSDIVIPYTDSTGTPTTATITAPSFQIQLQIANNSTEYLTVDGFQYTTMYVSSGVLTTSAPQSFGLSNLDPRYTCVAQTGQPSRVAIVEALFPNTTYTGLTTSKNCQDYDYVGETAPLAITSTQSDPWFISSLPKADSTSYFLEFSAQGYFEDGPRSSTGEPTGKPTDRLIYNTFVSTQ